MLSLEQRLVKKECLLKLEDLVSSQRDVVVYTSLVEIDGLAFQL